MARNKVEISGINTKDIIVLTNEEMQQLFIRKNEGDLYARDLLAQGNLKLVLSILRKFSNREECISCSTLSGRTKRNTTDYFH